MFVSVWQVRVTSPSNVKLAIQVYVAVVPSADTVTAPLVGDVGVSQAEM